MEEGREESVTSIAKSNYLLRSSLMAISISFKYLDKVSCLSTLVIILQSTSSCSTSSTNIPDFNKPSFTFSCVLLNIRQLHPNTFTPHFRTINIRHSTCVVRLSFYFLKRICQFSLLTPLILPMIRGEESPLPAS